MQLFAVGQRWFCESESQLGLGIVSEVNGRQVRIYFPLAQSERLYSQISAPLTRLIYNIGEEVENVDGESVTIVNREVMDNVVYYHIEKKNRQIGRAHV